MDCKKGGTVVPIKIIEIHPYYIYGKPNFDVSLLRMAMPVDFSEVIRPIGISDIKGKVLSAKFMTTYWPRIVVSKNKRTTKHSVAFIFLTQDTNFQSNLLITFLRDRSQLFNSMSVSFGCKIKLILNIRVPVKGKDDIRKSGGTNKI